MMQRTFSSLTLAALGGWLALACGGSATSSEGKGSSCSDLCEQAATCSKRPSSEDCTKTCTDNELINRGAQEVISQCALEADCNTSNPIATLECLDEGIGELETSEEAKKFCDGSRDKLSSCSDTKDEDCRRMAKLFGDELLKELNECIAKNDSCQAAQTCIVFELVARVDVNDLQNPSNPDSFFGAIAAVFGGELPDLGIPGIGTGTDDGDDDTGAGGEANDDVPPPTGGGAQD